MCQELKCQQIWAPKFCPCRSSISTKKRWACFWGLMRKKRKETRLKHRLGCRRRLEKSFEDHHFGDQVVARKGASSCRKRIGIRFDHFRCEFSFAAAECKQLSFHLVCGSDPFCRYPHWSMHHGRLHVAQT